MLQRLLGPLLIALALLAALLFAAAWIPLLQARDAWRAGRNAEAIGIAARWSPAHLWRAQWEQIVAAAYLSAGDDAAARPHLAAMGHVWPPAIDRLEMLRALFARGRYAELLDYDFAGRTSSDSPEILLVRAAAQASLNRVAAAAETLRAIDPSKVERRRYTALRGAIEQRQAGVIPYVFDRSGNAIAVYKLQNGELTATDADFAPLIDANAGSLTLGSHVAQLGTSATIDTTLDPFVQKAALAALGTYRGSLIAIDPRTNEILALASNALSNLALEREYEPGSVIKTLTGLDALTSGMNVDAMFPYACRGALIIDGRHFGDWVPQGHGTLVSIDDALAVSCNVFFADLGLRLGRDRLERFLTSAGFGGQVNVGVFQVPLGRVVGPVYNDFETAFLAVGLEHEQINAMHLAMLASMMANRGVLTTPRLLRGRRSLFGETIAGPPPQGSTRIASVAAAERMIRAMQTVATEPHGTGRRAPVEGVPLAMKTGTAGDRKDGLEALIMAFAPVNSPKIAFAIIAENAGPAEFAGAQIAHDFLERIFAREPSPRGRGEGAAERPMRGPSPGPSGHPLPASGGQGARALQ